MLRKLREGLEKIRIIKVVELMVCLRVVYHPEILRLNRSAIYISNFSYVWKVTYIQQTFRIVFKVIFYVSDSSPGSLKAAEKTAKDRCMSFHTVIGSKAARIEIL